MEVKWRSMISIRYDIISRRGGLNGNASEQNPLDSFSPGGNREISSIMPCPYSHARSLAPSSCAWRQCKIVEFAGSSDAATLLLSIVTCFPHRIRQRVCTTWTACQEARQWGRRDETALLLLSGRWTETRRRQAGMAAAEAEAQ